MSALFSLRLSLLERILFARRRNVPQHLQTGERGELAALFFLRRNGYVVVARRWKTPRQRGDIDLVAWEGDTLCFVEVKTRGSRAVASAESAVDEDKRRVLRRIARQYAKSVEPAAENLRFDVVSVYFEARGPEFTVFKGAFDW